MPLPSPKYCLMDSDRCPTRKMASVTPPDLSHSNWWDNMGFPATDIMGLGIVSVRGLRRSPLPPAKINAYIEKPSALYPMVEFNRPCISISSNNWYTTDPILVLIILFRDSEIYVLNIFHDRNYWLPCLGSNQSLQLQRLTCYHYTTGHCIENYGSTILTLEFLPVKYLPVVKVLYLHRFVSV